MKCEYQDCVYDTDGVIPKESTVPEKLQLMQMHIGAKHAAPPVVAPVATARMEKFPRPKLMLVDGYIDEEAWEYFINSWKNYKTLANPGGSAREILGACLGEVDNMVFARAGSEVYNKMTEANLLEEARKMVVKKRNKLVNRLKLNSLVQGGDESVTGFETRLKPLARTGKFKEKCGTCQIDVDYTDQMVLDNLIRGLADEDTKKKVLAMPEENCTLESVLKFVQAEEIGKLSLSDSKAIESVAGLSGYKKKLKEEGTKVFKGCHNCGDEQRHSKENCKARKSVCYRCGVVGHFKGMCKYISRAEAKEAAVKGKASAGGKVSAGGKEEAHSVNSVHRKKNLLSGESSSQAGNLPGNSGNPSGDEEFLMGVEEEVREDNMQSGHEDLSLIKGVTAASKDKVKPGVPSSRRVLKHMKYDKSTGQFIPNNRKKKNRVQVTVKVDEKNFRILHEMLNHASGDKVTKGIRVPDKRMHREAVGDTGATVCCSGPDTMEQLGLKVHELLATELSLFAANNKGLTVLGALPVMITVPTADGSTVSTRDLLYIVEELSCMFLSRDSLADLGAISESFPLGRTPESYGMVAGMRASNPNTAVDEPCITPRAYSGELAECGCPLRETAPEPPVLPAAATEENREILEKFLVDTYRASTFNTCQHQPLPEMHGPPLEIHLKKEVRPKAVFTPAAVPIHWTAKVKADLDRDVALGVLELVEPNEPITWCHRMVVCRKHNGDPRRTVDLQSLNEASVRQCHPTAPPLQQAMDVPHNTKKTTLDAWNGYHSIGLREEDRHMTTFITPWG